MSPFVVYGWGKIQRKNCIVVQKDSRRSIVCVYDLLIKIHNICTQTMRTYSFDALNIASHQRRDGDVRRTVYTRSYNSLSLVIFYFIIFIIMPAFMIIAAVINIHNVILVLFSISTCAISFIILLRFVYYLYIIGIFAHILSIWFCYRLQKRQVSK